jgi:hypothetical protein
LRSGYLVFFQRLHLVSRRIACLAGLARVGHFAVVHVGPDAILGNCLGFRRHPLTIESGRIAVAGVNPVAGTHALDDAFALAGIDVAGHGSRRSKRCARRVTPAHAALEQAGREAHELPEPQLPRERRA